METELIALISTSAGIAMCVVPMQSVLTLLGHSLALVIPVMMVTVSIVSILTNVLMKRILVMKTQRVLTLLDHSVAPVILVISVTVSDASMLMNVQLELIIAMKTQLVVTRMAHLNAHAMMDSMAMD